MRLTAIFDSCHSGSALDLPYIYSTQGVLKEPNLAKEAGQGLLGIVSSYARGDLSGVASTAMGFFKKATSGNDTYERNLRTKTSPADVVMWSGSKDSQTSYGSPSSITSSEHHFFPPSPSQSTPTKWEDCMSLEPFVVNEDGFHVPFREAFVPYRDMDGNILI